MNGSGANVAGCATCKGRCCREYRVEVNAVDVRILAAGMVLHPDDFITLWETAEGGDGFRLRPGGPAFELNLIRNDVTRGCVFLMEIAPDKARCGVYAHRPQVCRNFPTMLQGGAVAVRQEVKCGPDAWNLAAMDLPTYRRDLMRSAADRAEHRQVVAAWNAAIDACGQEKSPSDLYDFLLSYPSPSER